MDEKSYKNISIYYIEYMKIKGSKYLTINSVNPVYVIINKVNEYFEEINKERYLRLVATNESKQIRTVQKQRFN